MGITRRHECMYFFEHVLEMQASACSVLDIDRCIWGCCGVDIHGTLRSPRPLPDGDTNMLHGRGDSLCFVASFLTIRTQHFYSFRTRRVQRCRDGQICCRAIFFGRVLRVMVWFRKGQVSYHSFVLHVSIVLHWSHIL